MSETKRPDAGDLRAVLEAGDAMALRLFAINESLGGIVTAGSVSDCGECGVLHSVDGPIRGESGHAEGCEIAANIEARDAWNKARAGLAAMPPAALVPDEVREPARALLDALDRAEVIEPAAVLVECRARWRDLARALNLPMHKDGSRCARPGCLRGHGDPDLLAARVMKAREAGTDAVPNPGSAEMLLRNEWWMNHGHPDARALYGDDGEMQCAACGIDFLRMPLGELRALVQRKRRDAAMVKLATKGDSNG